MQPIKQKLVELIALMEAGVDFAEDDVPVLAAEIILQHIDGSARWIVRAAAIVCLWEAGA